MSRSWPHLLSTLMDGGSLGSEDTAWAMDEIMAGDASPVGAELRTLLAARFAGPVLPARTGVGGAAWLALAELDPALATPETHARLCA